MAEQKLKIIISAVDEAKGILKRVQGNLAEVASASRKAGLMIGAMGAGLILAGKKAITSYGIQEQAEARLFAGLANVQVVTDETRNSMLEYAKSLQEVTTFGDEQIISGMGILSTFQLNQRQIENLTPRILDMAASLEKSTGQQQDLEAISIAVGKAMTLGVGSLTRYGVVISDASKEAFLLADQQGKLDIITRELDKNFKGIAKAVGDTATGAFIKMKNAIGDVWEEIGKELMPTVEKMAIAIKDFAQNTMPIWIAKTKKIVGWFIEHKEVIVILAGAIVGALVPAVVSATIAFATLALTLAPFVLGGALIGAVIYGLTATGGATEKLDERIVEINEEIRIYQNELENARLGTYYLGEEQLDSAIKTLELDKRLVEINGTLDEVNKRLEKGDAWWVKYAKAIGMNVNDAEDLKDVQGILIMQQQSIIAQKEKEGKALEAVRTKYKENQRQLQENEQALKNAAGAAGELTEAQEKAAEAAKKLAEDQAKAYDDMSSKIVNTLIKLKDRILGLDDEEIGALEKIISLNKEKLKTMYASDYFAKTAAQNEIKLAEQRISAIKRQRAIPTVAETLAQAQNVRGVGAVHLQQLGLPTPRQSFIAPLASTPTREVRNFSFNFAGAFIGSKQQFINEIRQTINRESELRALAGT